MDKNLQMVTFLLLLLFVSGVVEGRKNCRHRYRTKCYPKENCEPRACAIFCTGYEDFECDGSCVCLDGCGPRNSTTTSTRNHPPPPPLPIYSRRCMV
ncbi:hypothetical protein ABFS82_11G019900 [Erythranthe guttata]